MQDIHLDGWPLHFWPKWVINITKWSIQIYSFWQNSRPQRPKMALFWAIIEIERALFVSFYCISTQDRATFGQSEIRRDVFVHTATMQHSKGMLLKQENLQKAFFVFTALSLHLKGRHWHLSLRVTWESGSDRFFGQFLSYRSLIYTKLKRISRAFQRAL